MVMTMMSSISRAVVLLAVAQTVLAGGPQGRLRKSELPSTGEDWIAMPEGASFQPATILHAEKSQSTKLQSAQRRFLGYDKQFVDGTETYYDDYAQAWRLVGFYIDCNAVETEQESDRRRKLNDYDDYDAEEQDGTSPCARFLLWAAYVDLDYAGGGIGEYQFYNRKTESWKNSTCTASSGRCERMDCHLPDTNFQLLGYFKEPNFAMWMEQLFKHEGACVWTSAEYTLMSNYRQSWPEGCSATKVQVNNNYLYYDTKPLKYGGMGIGLYTDTQCSVDYTGDEYTLASALSKNDVYPLVRYEDSWNSALDIYKICQPCKAYSLSSQDYQCDDQAGYTNVNQCMKFATHTYMQTASFQDIILASEQGTITQVTIGDKVYGSDYFGIKSVTVQDIKEPGWIILAVSMLTFIAGAIMLVRSTMQSRRESMSMREPLVHNQGGVSA